MGGAVSIVLLAIMLPLVLNEVGELSPWLAKRLLCWGAKLLGSQEDNERYGEDWLANLDCIPGKLTKLLWACSLLLWGVPRLRIQISRRVRDQADPRPYTLIRDRLLYLCQMRSMHVVNPGPEPTPTFKKLAKRHSLEPGEELIAIWRLGGEFPWGSSDSLAFTSSKISIADSSGALRIPYSHFGELEFKSHILAMMVGNSAAYSSLIAIEGADLQWRSRGFSTPLRHEECNQIAKLLNEIKQFLLHQDRRGPSAVQ